MAFNKTTISVNSSSSYQDEYYLSQLVSKIKYKVLYKRNEFVLVFRKRLESDSLKLFYKKYGLRDVSYFLKEFTPF